MKSPAEMSAQIRSLLRGAGFDLVGIAAAVSPTGYDRLLDWVTAGHAADMDWVQRRLSAYQHPDGVMPGTKSVIMAGMNYFQGPDESAGTGAAATDRAEGDVRVARYAWGSVDYHDLLKARLKPVAASIRHEMPEARTRIVVDTAPLLERDFARVAGIGWFGKNTMLISRQMGSWFLLGAILTDAELQYDNAFEVDHCGTCTRCLDACPTQAFPEPGVLDARRCISYQTIENRFQPVPEGLREGHGNWLFGCDVCQDVCPWNRFAKHSDESGFQKRAELHGLDCLAILDLNEQDFQKLFGKTPLSRSGRAGLLRNAAIVLGNTGNQFAVISLKVALGDHEHLVRGAAAWALGRLGGPDAQQALLNQQLVETDATVRSEIENALGSLRVMT